MEKVTSTQVCTSCGGDPQPIESFYDYRSTGGVLFKRCKSCCVAKSRRYDISEEFLDMDERIALLKSYRPARRSNALFRWIKENEINRSEFSILMKWMEQEKRLHTLDT